MDYKIRYEEWLQSKVISEEVKNELKQLNDEKEIEDRFYRDLEFGTGGLRGVIGYGDNRMNTYTVGKATQGFANYLLENFDDNRSVAIAYDSRNMSVEFAKSAALTLCGNGIKVYLFKVLEPTPVLSFAVRHLNCSGGIVVTASHNPKQYNGYKVYGPDGGQVTDGDANKIIGYVKDIKGFEEIKTISEEEALEKGLLVYIGEDVDKAYIDAIKKATIRKELVSEKAKDLNIIYTPIHGSGNIPVRRVLAELGYENVNVVKEQELPDGNFPTAPYPNPEDPKVFKLALEMAEKSEPDIIFGTDPDCDRIGVVVKDKTGDYKVLTGNQTGMLLTHYILSSLSERNEIPDNGVVIKTIVTTESANDIAKAYNVEIMDTLTGFKYIGEKMTAFEKDNSHKYLFGFEESYGYLIGDHARDKDAVVAAMLIAEMTLYYKENGMSLYDGLLALYEKYGYYKEALESFELTGKEGQEKIAKCIENLRSTEFTELNRVKLSLKEDYKLSTQKNMNLNSEVTLDLPKSNVLKFIFEDDSWFVVRPSGTEPKMKLYIAVKGNSIENSEENLNSFKEAVRGLIEKNLN
ncbi:phospho-sugar mutase [Clostridium intestinale]|uniref:phosphoglucomutase (alpha-D-glucose-1,6-bisphosphate-dependent) n=1 Tax=Clostridium intestinale DSM 6191 TaxID=1121320 RepID=A0A1M5Z168_9CLOT|nr:phospho-sugar mutase [Clostridium intestinale]SHI17930.1 phosphoglucomutase [Clostridium intestinale DSM 6191]